MIDAARQVNRLPEGGRLNRAKILRFWYDDKKYEGYPGDTLASALLANGITLIARSFKYHRPRGIFSAGSEEPNALVQLEVGPYTEPNRRATEVELYDGLVAHSQNCFPSVRYDFGAIASKTWRILPAGFYYKTFMWPPSLWLFYEKFIRKAAGLGVSPNAPDPDAYDKLYAHTDVLIVGGGVAGLQAACAAATRGARVMLVDEGCEFGGALLREHVNSDDDEHVNDALTIGGLAWQVWLAERVAELTANSRVTLLPRTTVTGYYHDNFLVANQRVTEHLGPNRGDNAPKERLWKIRARRVVLATGSIERPLVFADNDRPGVMLAAAVRAYVNRFAVLPGARIVVFTNNDSAYQTALAVQRVGGEVSVVDVRDLAADDEPAGGLIAQVRAQGIAIYGNHTITGVEYARGKMRGVSVMELAGDGASVTGDAREIACDIIAASGGWTPTVHLYSQARGDLKFCDVRHCFLPAGDDDDASRPNNAKICVGSCNGTFALADCLREGDNAGTDAAVKTGYNDDINNDASAYQTEPSPPVTPLRPLWILPCDHPIGRGAKKHFHELHNDSTIADIHLAAREGFAAAEHLKRYTTTGMGTDQGKTSNLNALFALSQIAADGDDESAITSTAPPQKPAPTTYRPPFTPLTFGAVIGHERRELFEQKRSTPMHEWHDRHGAIYEDVGDWKRPYYFPRQGENMRAAVARECISARTGVGVLDASTLGKIDIRGADATRLLNMVYTNAWNKLAVGGCRYGVMLNEHGMVFDDGVTTRLGDAHFHMTTTTGGAARVLTHLEEWLQTEMPDAQVFCTSVTEQWAVASVSGPRSREVLSQLTDAKLDAESFPFMSMQECVVADIPARVFRISFTGELAFEINVPARYGLALWQAIIAAGEAHDIQPYGTEAMHVLRAEKGFIIVGQDTDGTVTTHDLGMDWIVSKAKADFVGKRSLSRTDTARGGRKQLVGLLTEDADFVLPEGAHVVAKLRAKPPMKMLGHVSSSYHSATLGRSIALALIADGLARKGEVLEVALMDGKSQKVTVTDSVFYDPSGGLARG